MAAPAPGNACLEENAVVAFVHGELDAEAAAHVEAHLDACDRCSALVVELARVFPDLAPSGDPPPSELVTTGTEDEDDTSLPLPRGATVGRYVVLDLVGAGAMGLVHAAYDPELDRRVALKLLRQRALDESQRARLVREAQAAARLSHPNVIVVHDVGEHEGAVFITMEFVDGTTLGEWVAAAPRNERELLAVFGAAGRGLAAAHEAGIVHRDFKPANVLVGRGPSPQVRVTDFGLARPQTERERPTVTITSPQLVESSRRKLLQSLTQTGALVGTPAYMSPEQLEGRIADERSDQFSFCVALYEALLGKRPFAGSSFAELSTNVCDGRFHDRAALATLRVGLRRALERGLQVDPAARFGSMAALLAAIEPPRRRRIAPVLGAAAIAGVSAWALAGIADEPPCDRGASRIDAIWNAALQRETEEAFAASGLPYRDHALATTRAALDGYAGAWRDTYIDACEAHRRGEQSADLLDRRMACLEDKRDAMRAIVEILVDADATAVERAPEAAHALPAIAACSDTATLREAVPPPPPELAPEVEALRASIAAARARSTLGHPREALQPAREAWKRAQEIDYAHIRARAAFILAETELDVNPSALQDELYVDAFALALEARDDRLAASVVLFMLDSYATPERARSPEAAHWIRVAEALVARLGGDSDVEGALLHSRSLLARERGDLDEARRFAAEEVELARAQDGPGRERVAVAITLLANTEFQLGDYAEAQALFEEALARDLELKGEGHPTVAISRQNVAAAMIARGLHAEALVHLRSVLTTREALFGEHAPQLLSVLQNLNTALGGTGHAEEAHAAIERALAIAIATYGDGDPNTELVRDRVGASHFQAGRFEDARRSFEQALAGLSARLPADDRMVALTRYNLGEVLLELGRIDDAAREATQAHEAIAAAFAGDHPYLGFTLTLLGRVALARDDAAEARNRLEQALAVREKAQGSPLERATTELFLGLALRTSDPDRSAALLDQARTTLEADQSPDAARLRALLD